MKKLIIGILTITFLFSSRSPSSAFENHTTKHVFDNGMTVVITEMPSTPLVSVYALVKTGSATEGKFLGTGISHFLEHMLFKGTHGRGAGEVASRIQAVGGTINASTGMDYTIYTITVPYESFDIALDILSDMLMNSSIEDEEVERERKVIFGEMRLYKDNPDRKVHELTFQNVYLRHPYRHPVIGYETLLADVSRSDLVEYYRTHYTPNNIIFSVAGQIVTDDILPKIEEAFKDFKRSRPLERHLPQEPAQISPRHYEIEYSTDLTRLSMSFGGISLLDPDLYALDVLATILGQGNSSRLYRSVYKDQELVYSISSSNYTPIDQGIFGINCLLEEKNIDQVKDSVFKEIRKIKKTGVTGDELEKVKQQVRSQHVLNNQTAAFVTYSQAVDEAFAGDYQFSRKYIDGVAAVTNEDIKRVANQYLIESAVTTVILRPEQKADDVTSAASEVGTPKDIVKYTLDNGITVLLREDHTFPIVSMRLLANGGVRQEPTELNGLFKMMAATWSKGTKRYDANDIADLTEGRGISWGTFSGRNSYGVSFEMLTDQLPVVFDLLEEFVFFPTFPEDEIVQIKDDMKAAIRQREDNISSVTGRVLRETLFQQHPFRLEEGGTEASIDRITRDDMVKSFNQFTVPSNIVIAAYGDIQPEGMLKDIDRLFGGMKDPSVVLKLHPVVPIRQPQEVVHRMDKEQAMVMLGFQGPALDDPDYYGVDVLSSILGSSFSGRLFKNIREQLGDAYTLGGGYSPGPDAGFIYFYVLTTDDEAKKVTMLLKKEIKDVQTEYVSEEELKSIKTYLKGSFKADLETNGALSFTTGLNELYGLGYDHHENFDSGIDGVTREDILSLAQKYLDLDRVAVVVTRPEEKQP